MKKIILSSIIIAFLASCSSTKQQLTPAEVRFMTTKQFDADYDVTFKSTISLLQSEGFLIDDADTETGLINAHKRIELKGKKTSISKFSFYLDTVNKNTIEVKMTIYEGFIDKGMNIWTGQRKATDKESMVQDAAIYNNWFNNLKTEIERRKAMR
jgi:uncharacterized lipoprotein